ncbi:MAG: hypothetical protein BGO49_14085 [Planctomycetales bacterium 71-10]|nr:MAG: hypothetical protein BGO49_14085 [Planctomycetales bacterium 71-10]
MLSGSASRGDDDAAPPVHQQLTELGRQALANGAGGMARSFFQKALELAPGDADATKGLEEARASQRRLVERIALQDPATPPPPAPEAGAQPTPPPAPDAGPNNRATLEESERADAIAQQQLTSDVRQRMTAAREQANKGQIEAALDANRLARNVVQSATNVPESVRNQLLRELQAQSLDLLRNEERIVNERIERQRLESAAEQRNRGLSQLTQNEQTIKAMMEQFDALMGEGVYNTLYNGGMGNIALATAPFYEARLLSQHARSLMHKGTLPYSDEDPAPYAGMFVSTTMGFLSQEKQFEELKEYRFMLTMQDVTRAAVPFPDDKIIEYPDANLFRIMSERRIARYGKAVDVFDRDPKTKAILAKLDEPLAMNFPNETPLEDILKYVKQATQTPQDNGIPIYVDPIGLNEADKTMTSPVSIDLDGVPLKTTLRLMLKQLGLTYTVKDGFLMITSQESEDQQTDIRVYPVADLALIPMSLIMGGGGGMGGMGGGMGGMGGGMGMMSIPVVPTQDDPAGALMQKKSN